MDSWRRTCLNERIDNRPQFIVGGRGSGKTARLIREANETDGIIICPTPQMADYICNLAQNLDCEFRRPVTYRELFRYRPDAFINRYFDEYGQDLLMSLYQRLNAMEQYNVRTVMIDEGSIKSLNDILANLKVSDMDGRELRFKIEILGRNESDD